MRIFLKSQDNEIWDILSNDPFTPTQLKKGTSAPKAKEYQTAYEKHNVLLNSKAKILSKHCEYDNVVGCDTTKQIWDTLKTSHEGCFIQ